jgi:6-phosphogluconate dehydrogenase
MQIGVMGRGRMGGNMSRHLMKAGHHCVVFDVDANIIPWGQGNTGA